MQFKLITLDHYVNPVDVAALFDHETDSIFLDSAQADSPKSEYTFIGVRPIWRFVSNKGQHKLNGKPLQHPGDCFEALDALLSDMPLNFKSPLPFVAGAMGFFSYEAAKQLEELPDTVTHPVTVPDAYFVLYDNLIIFDLKNKQIHLTALGHFEDAETSLKNIRAVLEKVTPSPPVILPENPKVFHSNFDRETYIEAVDKMRHYMVEGDTYIANMSRQVWCDSSEDGFTLYRQLREKNGAPFGGYLHAEDFEILSSSPEAFLRIVDRKVETRPIKGTTPRGATAEEDRYYRDLLKNSEKDHSELLMVVDLERNDLSKVCAPHTVEVTELFQIESYATVHHLVCAITGTLKPGISPVMAVRACYPGGSITGTPKIRTMEIIDELEGTSRNLYTGSMGYFDLRGNADFNIIIRTILKKNGKASFGIGGGITWESDPESEWEETIDKGRALMEVLSCEK